MTHDASSNNSVVQGPDGKLYIRPDNECYPCDVYGPNCPWHKDDWVEEPTEVRP